MCAGIFVQFLNFQHKCKWNKCCRETNNWGPLNWKIPWMVELAFPWHARCRWNRWLQSIFWCCFWWSHKGISPINYQSRKYWVFLQNNITTNFHLVQDIYEATKFHPLTSANVDAGIIDKICLLQIKFSIHQISATLCSLYESSLFWLKIIMPHLINVVD